MDSFYHAVENVLTVHIGRQVLISQVRPLGGGCINHAKQITTDAGDFFVKRNSSANYPGMFEAEAKGLHLLATMRAIRVPKVIACGENGGISFIILEFVKSNARGKNFWENFAVRLAQLHRNTASTFGLDFNNYIGSLLQSNHRHDDWVSFFIKERLEPQVRLALDNGLLFQKNLKQFEFLYSRLQTIFPAEAPALLHGDLWSGNLITDENGEVCVIDPAVYYGHREMELAFTALFGGFEERFYHAYHESYPLNPGFEQRKDIYNLYPLLVHVNLFGGSYVSSVEAILKSRNL